MAKVETQNAQKLKNQAVALQREALKVPGVKELIELHQKYAEMVALADAAHPVVTDATTVSCTPQG